MKKIKITYILLASILVFNYGCSTVKILNVNSEDAFSLANYKTYNFYNVDIDIDAMPEFKNRLQWIKEALVNQLELRGLKQSSDNPDLLLNIGLVLEKKMQTRETDFRSDFHYMGTRNYSWKVEEVEVGEYHEGTFSIDFVEPESKALKCMAVTQGVVVKNDKKSKKNVEIAAENLFKKIK